MEKTLFSNIPELKKKLDDPESPPELKRNIRADFQGAISRAGEERASRLKTLYEYDDSVLCTHDSSPVLRLQTLDELLERDERREKDGFPKKVILGRIASPRGKKSVIVPSTVEEKFYHDNRPKTPGQGGDEGGSGDGEEGEVIGEAPLKQEGQQGAGGGPGDQQGGESHELDDSRAYDIGKALTEKFQLPNIQEKGKKSALYKFTYELTDINRKFGQILEKKRSLKNVLRTNLILGTFDLDTPSFDKLVISPNDLVYRIVSPEKEYESQAMVFFIRDYSGSMYGETTEVVLSQHVLLYSWLLYQYQERVEKRFILHDTEAKEVDNFVSYYKLNNGGGTSIASAYKLVNSIIENENLASAYNIYIFQGTDGDDWDAEGKDALPEIQKLLTTVNRMGITVVRNRPGSSGDTYIEQYLGKSKVLSTHPNLIRLSTLTSENKSQDDLIKSIKQLVD
ncbi:MAG: DUF444 family protein [Candidatus Riflebacteria bacterium]|nr:DUF444 family protein [Candidatus Riflebacteria bacterium]